MKISIKYKLLPIIVIGIVSITSLFFFAFINTQENIQHTLNGDAINTSKGLFYNLEDNDIKMLSSTLEVLLMNNELRDTYLSNNREDLYKLGQPIFSKLKDQFGITHFYIHSPDGINFIRFHKKEQFGDNISLRKTFEKSVQSKGFGSGLELGKTAFALRVVHPYYNGSELIGYIELGEEIDNFLKLMRKQTGNEFGLFIRKEFIKHEDWKSMREINGLKDNYDDLQNYIIIDSTTNSISSFATNREDTLSEGHESSAIEKFQIGDSTYITGGFPLYDAGGQDVGTVLVVKDITSLENTFKNNTRSILIISIIAAVIISMILILVVNKYVLKPIDNIVDATTRVAGGDFSVEIKPQSNDEIGDLAIIFNGFKRILVGTAKELEDAHRKS